MNLKKLIMNTYWPPYAGTYISFNPMVANEITEEGRKHLEEVTEKFKNTKEVQQLLNSCHDKTDY